MTLSLVERLKEKGIDEAYLSVKIDNVAALRAHERVGYQIVGHKRFVRILNVNIPYHSL
jgi:RimJ/RimL family protein N-acetyltransferase